MYIPNTEIHAYIVYCHDPQKADMIFQPFFVPSVIAYLRRQGQDARVALEETWGSATTTVIYAPIYLKREIYMHNVHLSVCVFCRLLSS